ncbi:UNVERIFIED_CONTAM: hypothetical protein Sradi_1968100 [Sesamum radiatum]|uniref:START domain-containing protein n=1 Tax=Sesamum radiatum TaxID=300843 RepID=A0AAW2TEJ0_SESRA
MALVEAFLEILKRPTIWAMNLDSCKAKVASFGSCASDNGMGKEQIASLAADDAVCSSSELGKEDGVLITYEDLEHLCHLVERKDAGPPWKHVMDRSTQSMSYQAWQREPEVVPCLSVPRRDKPRRVDLYYSSWYIQAVESRKGNGQLSACEVTLFHHEDMGIPWEIAKFGVSQGMWGAVKNIERGFRAYQKHRLSGAPISRHAFMAQVNTKLDPDYLKILEGEGDPSETQSLDLADEKPKRVNIPKLLIIGGAVAVACSLDRGLLTKTLIFGVARRFGNIGRRACPGSN